VRRGDGAAGERDDDAATYTHLWPTAEERISKASEALMKSSSRILADSVRTEAT